MRDFHYGSGVSNGAHQRGGCSAVGDPTTHRHAIVLNCHRRAQPRTARLRPRW